MGIICHSKEEVIKFVKDNYIEFISLWFIDILGRTKSYEINSTIIEKAMNDGMNFDGSSISGFQEIHESDLIALPDPTTFQVVPWCKNSARLICDVLNPDRTPYEGDPRFVLKRNLKKCRELGYEYKVGPELEYFYFKNNQGTEFIDRGGYFDLTPLDLAVDLRRQTVKGLVDFGCTVDYSHHEVSPSQHEVCLVFGDALTMADQVQTYKLVVKEIANRNGYYATFMPKPVFGINGSGMHTHQSLSDGKGKNLFYGPDEKRAHLSEVGQQFTAGLLKYAPEFTAITNPTVNSYKRIVPGYEAPCYITWAARNRSTMCRVPIIKAGEEKAKRVELRSPDPSCNPYLSFSVMLGAGLAGIKEKLKLEDPQERNLFALTMQEMRDQGIKSLPGSLGESLANLRKSKWIKECLGEHVFERFLVVKQQEWEEFSISVHQWELDRYLSVI